MSGPTHADLALARCVAARACEVEGVRRLDDGAAGTFATWRQGQRCGGVRIDAGPPRRARLRVVAASAGAVAGLGERVRAHITASDDLRDLVVDVHVSDLEVAALPEPRSRSDA
jgi:hypothetical protein